MGGLSSAESHADNVLKQNTVCTLPEPIIPQSILEMIDGLLFPSKAMDIFVYKISSKVSNVLDQILEYLILSVEKTMERIGASSTGASMCSSSVYDERDVYFLAGMKAVKRCLDDVFLYLCGASGSAYKEIASEFRGVEDDLVTIIGLLAQLKKKCSTHFEWGVPAHLAQLLNSAQTLQQRLRADDILEMLNIHQDIIRNSRIVFSTLASAGHALLKDAMAVDTDQV